MIDPNKKPPPPPSQGAGLDNSGDTFVNLLAVGLIVLLCILAAGCATTERVITVEVPVPVACKVAEPARPALAIDTVPELDARPLDVQVRHLRADHDARDGYEGELRTALQACRTVGAK